MDACFGVGGVSEDEFCWGFLEDDAGCDVASCEGDLCGVVAFFDFGERVDE